jgi:uncharacterized membrane protein (TIGR02234 family)
MADGQRRRGRFAIRLAQLLLVVAAGALWAASRLPWVVIRAFDGLGQPKQVAVSGAAWSTVLLPLALLSLVTAIAAVAVRGWPLRVLAVLMAAASLAAGYLAISMWVAMDVTARGADIADIPVVSLVGGDRRYAGAVLTLVAAACNLMAATLLMRSAASGDVSAKYVAPAARRSVAGRDDGGSSASETPEMSERMIWDAIDEGRDPTGSPPGSDAEGR